MKLKLSIFLILSCIFINAQTKDELKVKSFFWGEKDTHKDIVEIPEKWKNESAVVLFKNQNYSFEKFAKTVTYLNSTRMRVKLLDKSALKEFSEFSFKDLLNSKRKKISSNYNASDKSTKNYVGIKIVKPNGKEIEVNIKKESVQVDNETKIAISNLEVGDIIDYYVYNEDEFKSSYAFGFDPVETTLCEEYPVLDFKLFFETQDDFFINFNSYNGAPDLKELPSPKKNVRLYSLVASNIEKENSKIWFFPLIELPAYKFQVYFARSGKFEDKALAFLPEKENIIKKNVTKEEVLSLYDSRFKPEGDVSDVKYFLKGKKFKNNTEKVTEAYYFMRHNNLTKYIEAYAIKEAEIMYFPFSYYETDAYTINNQKQFIRVFTNFLKNEKIDYEIVVAQKRYDGPIEDLLIEQNVNVLLKTKTETPLYIEYFGPHSSINEFSPLIEGTKVYLLSASKSNIDVVKNGELPTSTFKQNESSCETTLTLGDDFSSLSINRISSHKGHQKEEQLIDRLIYNDYVHEDYKKYKTKSLIELVGGEKVKAKYQKQIDAFIEKLKEKQKEYFKNCTKSEFKLEEEAEDYTYSIIETGRYGFDSCFKYSESFKLKSSFIKKAGSNYILEIGKLISEQINLDDKSRKRKENIHMNNPRSFNNKITFNIPEGYTVTGLDKLNVSIDNSTGAFISDAKIEGNKLIITTTKQYKNYYEPNSNWGLMVEFLDAANQFTNEKILLKRI